jgi:MoaA/NifB/PqqE/SkfB family radical SAM enzyme
MNAPTGSPVFQIHPSLRCNLACAHCYSASSPWSTTTLDVGLLCDAIRDAADLGYRTVSVSGGEPLLYPELAAVLSFARELGLKTTVTTNGMLLDGRHLERVAPFINLLAISLDGDAAHHNEMRGDARAHERLMAGLNLVRERGVAFGFIHTLTRKSWEHIEAIVDFAARSGASLVQLHPLELVGRAKETLGDAACDEATLAQVYILTLALSASYVGKPLIQYDVLPARKLATVPETVHASEGEIDCARLRAQDLTFLVLEADGTVVPMNFGFSRRYRIGNVKDARLRDAWPGFARDVYAAFRSLCRRTFERVTADEAPRFTNWYEVLHDASIAEEDVVTGAP